MAPERARPPVGHSRENPKLSVPETKRIKEKLGLSTGREDAKIAEIKEKLGLTAKAEELRKQREVDHNKRLARYAAEKEEGLQRMRSKLENLKAEAKGRDIASEIDPYENTADELPSVIVDEGYLEKASKQIEDDRNQKALEDAFFAQGEAMNQTNKALKGKSSALGRLGRKIALGLGLLVGTSSAAPERPNMRAMDKAEASRTYTANDTEASPSAQYGLRAPEVAASKVVTMDFEDGDTVEFSNAEASNVTQMDFEDGDTITLSTEEREQVVTEFDNLNKELQKVKKTTRSKQTRKALKDVHKLIKEAQKRVFSEDAKGVEETITDIREAINNADGRSIDRAAFEGLLSTIELYSKKGAENIKAQEEAKEKADQATAPNETIDTTLQTLGERAEKNNEKIAESMGLELQEDNEANPEALEITNQLKKEFRVRINIDGTVPSGIFNRNINKYRKLENGTDKKSKEFQRLTSRLVELQTQEELKNGKHVSADRIRNTRDARSAQLRSPNTTPKAPGNL